MRASPVSTTKRMPGIVSEVSAMFVARTILRRGVGASGPAEVLYPHFGITAFARVGGRRQMSMAVSLQRWNELDSAG